MVHPISQLVPYIDSAQIVVKRRGSAIYTMYPTAKVIQNDSGGDCVQDVHLLYEFPTSTECRVVTGSLSTATVMDDFLPAYTLMATSVSEFVYTTMDTTCVMANLVGLACVMIEHVLDHGQRVVIRRLEQTGAAERETPMESKEYLSALMRQRGVPSLDCFTESIVSSFKVGMGCSPVVEGTLRKLIPVCRWQSKNVLVTMWTLEPVVSSVIISGILPGSSIFFGVHSRGSRISHMMLTPELVTLISAYSRRICSMSGVTSSVATSSFTKLKFQPNLSTGTATSLTLFGNGSMQLCGSPKDMQGMCSVMVETVKEVMESEPALFLETMRRADTPAL
ncbi:uncharacterized protein PpBr36_11068 [Pyricularia pennisetigena]|uniref:uncharacterized protein n=1 Tax=Pyricularia pennisetigena TaxID=1578925 RepID=UPI00114ED3F4|nr:uncharacterized protein PpBr36_11068 [Pyricularia pennisetigena]TLS20631.1 hypothetical protein PpBr36_11068 [Pyricularia pennisetigena]